MTTATKLAELRDMCDRAEQRYKACLELFDGEGDGFCPEAKITLQWTGQRPPFEQDTIAVVPGLVGVIENRAHMTVAFKVEDVRRFISESA